jgi:hypothetical protein
MYKAGSATGDYDGQMNATNFEKWVHEKVAHNLPCASIFVLDNAPCHSVLSEKAPSMYAVKMTQWNGISCDISMRQEELFLLVKENQPKEKISNMIGTCLR